LFLTKTHAAWDEKKVIARSDITVIDTEYIKDDGYRIFELFQIVFIFLIIIDQFSGQAIGYWVIEKASLAEFIIRIIKGNIKTRKTRDVTISRPNSFLFFIITSPPLSFY